MSGSFESVQWIACVHRLDLGLNSHPKEFWGSEPMPTPREKSPLSHRMIWLGSAAPTCRIQSRCLYHQVREAVTARLTQGRTITAQDTAPIPQRFSGKASALKAGDPWTQLSSPRPRRSHTSGLHTGTLAVALPGVWHQRVCVRMLIHCQYTEASALREEDPGFESCLRRDFSGSSHTRDLKIGILVATLPGAW